MSIPPQDSWTEHLDIIKIIISGGFLFLLWIFRTVFKYIIDYIKSQTEVNKTIFNKFDEIQKNFLVEKEALEKRFLAEKDELNNRLIKISNHFEARINEQAEKINIMQGEHNANHGK